MSYVVIDIETYSEIEIDTRKRDGLGLNVYSSDSSTEILMIAFSENGKEPFIYDCTYGRNKEINQTHFAKQKLLSYINDGYTIIAHNAGFELALIKNVWGIEIDPFKVEDTQLMGSYLNLPENNLKFMSSFIGDVKKMEEGKDLIPVFSRPQSSGRRITKENAPSDWELFMEYCLQDVAATVSIYEKIRNIIPQQEIFLMSLTLWENLKGIKINEQFLEQALIVEKLELDFLSDYVKKELNIDNPKSMTQVKEALKLKGYDITSVAKDVIPKILSQHPELEELINAISVINSKTSAKFPACKKIMVEGVVKNSLIYCGAKTSRWSSKGLQIHNFSNKPVDEDVKIHLTKGRYRYLTTLKQVNNAVRAILVPRKGHVFVVADYAQIESRLMAAYGKEQWKIDVFNTTGLIYEEAASRMFGVPAETCKKDGINKSMRQDGKVCELALQYGGGWSTIIKQIGDETRSKELVKLWREANSEIQKYRKEILFACYECLTSKGASYSFNNGLVKITNTPLGLCMELKSILGTRKNFIPNLKAVAEVRRIGFSDGQGEEIHAINGTRISGKLYGLLINETEFEFNNKIYSRKNNILSIYNKKSEKLIFSAPFYLEDNSYYQRTVINTKTFKRFEHINPIIQGVARDCLGYAMKQLTIMGYPPLFHVHDELIVECLEDEVEDVCSTIEMIMDFEVEGVKIKASPEVMTYYTK